jgi:hypothetical protein
LSRAKWYNLMVFGLVPVALEARNLSSKSFVKTCELFEANSSQNLASLEGFEPTTRCLEGSDIIGLVFTPHLASGRC